MTIPYDPRFLIRPFLVVVEGFPSMTYHAPSRGKALSIAWNSYNGSQDAVSFSKFLTMAKITTGERGERFGERILVGGREAFFVSSDGHYVRFVLPDGKTVSNSHPLDVEPVT